MMSLTALPACSASGKSATSVRTASGLRSNRTMISVTTPTVPSEPTITARRSGPTWSNESPPTVTTLPSAHTIVSPRTWLVVKPYFRQCAPPEFSATLPADRADDLARRVGCVVQVVGGHRGGDAEVGHPRLDDRALVLRVDGEDRAHPGQPDDDPVGDGQRTAGQAGPRTAGDERDPFPGADPHDRRNLLRARRQHHQRGNHPETGQPVAFIGAKLRRFRDETACADQPADLSADFLGDPPGGLLGHQVEIRRHGHRPLNPAVGTPAACEPS